MAKTSTQNPAAAAVQAASPAPIAVASVKPRDQQGRMPPNVGFDFSSGEYPGIVGGITAAPGEAISFNVPAFLKNRKLYLAFYGSVNQSNGEIRFYRQSTLVGKIPATTNVSNAVPQVCQVCLPYSFYMLFGTGVTGTTIGQDNSIMLTVNGHAGNQPSLDILYPLVFSAEFDQIKFFLTQTPGDVRVFLACLSF